MNELIARFDAALPDQWEPYATPTAESLSIIEARFAFRIPELLVTFALESKSFSSFFLSLGPDYSNHSHILTENEAIRSDSYWLSEGLQIRAPDNLVFITENFMEDYFWCLDIAQAKPELPVVFWARDGRREDGYANFTSFVSSQIEWYERAVASEA